MTLLTIYIVYIYIYIGYNVNFRSRLRTSKIFKNLTAVGCGKERLRLWVVQF